jgi:RNA polymerase sigma-70 factor (ECF subfamily)
MKGGEPVSRRGAIESEPGSNHAYWMKSSADYANFDDERLIRLILQSQEQALAQLYDRYHRLVFSLALAIVNDRATAEEITLDVFMRVWQKAGTYRPEQARVSTWLTHIARHHAIDVLRRRAARVDQFAVHWDEATSNQDSSLPDPQESVELSLRRQRIYAALARLPAEQREALYLAYFGGYTQSQIAQALKQPLGTVKTRLRLAMQKLREFLHEEQDLQNKSITPHSAYNIDKE